MLKKTGGFTFVELMVVVAIAGILAGLTVFGYKKVSSTGAAAITRTEMYQNILKLERFYSENGTYQNSTSQIKPIVAGEKFPQYALLKGPASSDQKLSLVAVPLGSLAEDNELMCMTSEGEMVDHAKKDCANNQVAIAADPCSGDYSQSVDNVCSGDDCSYRVICGACSGNCSWSYIGGSCSGDCQHAIIKQSCSGNCNSSLVMG